MSHKKKKARNRKQIIWFVVVSLLIYGIPKVIQWNKDKDLLVVSISNSDNKNINFKVELAVTPSQRAKGLMFRKEMQADYGMLFAFPESSVQSFYMKNTYIPLDMIFVSEDMHIVGILRDVPILNEKSRSVGIESKYVIELNAGTTKRLNINKGNLVKFDKSLSNMS